MSTSWNISNVWRLLCRPFSSVFQTTPTKFLQIPFVGQISSLFLLLLSHGLSPGFFLCFSWSGAKRQTKQVSKRTTKCWVEQLIAPLFHITLKIHPKKRFAYFYYSMAFLPCNLWSVVTLSLCTAVCAPQCSGKEWVLLHSYCFA